MKKIPLFSQNISTNQEIVTYLCVILNLNSKVRGNKKDFYHSLWTKDLNNFR